MSKGDVRETLWPRCCGGSEEQENVATKGAKNEISASVERNRLRLLSSRGIFALDFVKDKAAIPTNVIVFDVSKSIQLHGAKIIIEMRGRWLNKLTSTLKFYISRQVF